MTCGDAATLPLILRRSVLSALREGLGDGRPGRRVRRGPRGQPIAPRSQTAGAPPVAGTECGKHTRVYPDLGLTYFEKARRLAEGIHQEALVGKIRCLLELDEQALARDELESAQACFGLDVDLTDLRAQLEAGTSTQSE